MPIYSITDITKKPLSKYETHEIIKDLNELKQNGGITKVKDFDKLMTYFMKSKTFMKYIYSMDVANKYAQIFDTIIDLHPENGIFNDDQIVYLYQKPAINKSLIEKLVNRGYIMKYEHLLLYLTSISNINMYHNNNDNLGANINNYIIKVFVDRKHISDEEYVDITTYFDKDPDGDILFNYIYFTEATYIGFLPIDKNYIRDFILKFRFFNIFYNKMVNFTDSGICIPLSFVKLIIRDEIANKYIDDCIFQNIFNSTVSNSLRILNYYEILLDPLLYKDFKSKYCNLDADLNTKFICNLYHDLYFTVEDSIYAKYKDFFEYYDNRFNNLINEFKKINNKIILNNNLILSEYRTQICNKYNIGNITIDNIDNSTKNITTDMFEKIYSGEYNTELLNKCIKLNFTETFINYLLKTKHIDFDNETSRYAIYNENISVITHMLDNKYIGSDKDLLYCVYSGQFSMSLRQLYKKHNILISDDVYKQLKLRNSYIDYDLCINGEDINHMKKLDDEVDSEKQKIFPFDTYHDNTNYSFYYDMAKRGELTLDIICNIHHIIGVDGIKHLISIYMEHNQNKSEEKIKTTVKKIVKKIVKKSTE